LVSGIWYTGNPFRGRRKIVEKLKHLWVQYGTARNLRVVYILITLAALAAAGGAPSAGGGAGT
jgi:hypothetical protein